MGTPVPVEYPDLQDDKWYCTWVDVYFDLTAKTDCTQTWLARIHGPRRGDQIKYWIAQGYECTPEHELIEYQIFSSQRLVAMHGPYDSYDLCYEVCKYWWE